MWPVHTGRGVGSVSWKVRSPVLRDTEHDTCPRVWGPRRFTPRRKHYSLIWGEGGGGEGREQNQTGVQPELLGLRVDTGSPGVGDWKSGLSMASRPHPTGTEACVLRVVVSWRRRASGPASSRQSPNRREGALEQQQQKPKSPPCQLIWSPGSLTWVTADAGSLE